jgi:hypothetical protein
MRIVRIKTGKEPTVGRKEIPEHAESGQQTQPSMSADVGCLFVSAVFAQGVAFLAQASLFVAVYWLMTQQPSLPVQVPAVAIAVLVPLLFLFALVAISSLVAAVFASLMIRKGPRRIAIGLTIYQGAVFLGCVGLVIDALLLPPSKGYPGP